MLRVTFSTHQSIPLVCPPSDHHEDEEDLELHIHQEITAPDDSNTDNDEDEDMLLDH